MSSEMHIGTGVKPARPRVWRACEVCRKRKIKCDGQDPCMFCQTNGKQCAYVEAADNASVARQQTSDLYNRLTRVEGMLQSFIPMAQAFESWTVSTAEGLPFRMPIRSIFGGNPLLPPPSKFLLNNRSPLEPYAPSANLSAILENDTAKNPPKPSTGLSEISNTRNESSEVILSPEESRNTEDGEEEEAGDESSYSDRFMHLTKDSLGNMRYLGGASSFVLVEALKSIRQPASKASQSPGSTLGKDGEGLSKGAANMELPFFRPGVHYRRIEFLPLPEDIPYPSAAIADSLVETYFKKIHPTFPILHKVSFVARYTQAMRDLHSGNPSKDSAFLSSLFAVFAAASSLKAREENEAGKMAKQKGDAAEGFKLVGPTEFSGLEYYEHAQGLYWMGSRAMQLEHVQCLALLASVTAGWNTLSQSWILAGHAIRGAQDLGLHRSPRRLPLSPTEKEVRRRVWWAAYGLDKVLSISLGRPSATNDEDCDVELPVEVDDEDMGVLASGAPAPTQAIMAGFVALTKVYVIAGKIVRSATAIQRATDTSRGDREPPRMVAELDSELEEWIENLPHSVRFAANDNSRPEMLVLCLIAFFVYYASVINLHRPFIPDASSSSASNLSSLAKCVSAAKCCIRIGEMVKGTLPPSHHLSFAVQYITISGVILLRTVSFINDPSLVKAIINDAERCCSILEGMQDIWTGAKRCKEIVNDLMFVLRARWENAGQNGDDHPEPSKKRRRTQGPNPMPPPPLPSNPREFLVSPAPLTPSYSHTPTNTQSQSQSPNSWVNAMSASMNNSPVSSTSLNPLGSYNPSYTQHQHQTSNSQNQNQHDPNFPVDLSSYMGLGQEGPFGFDFLESDLPALLDSVVTVPDNHESDQTLINTQLLWQAIEDGEGRGAALGGMGFGGQGVFGDQGGFRKEE